MADDENGNNNANDYYWERKNKSTHDKNNEDGVNTRNGFPKYKRIMNHDKNLLSKPKSVTM